MEKLSQETVITPNYIIPLPRDHLHTLNTQLLKAIRYEAEQSTKSCLQLLSGSAEEALNNESDVSGVVIFKCSLAVI